MKTATRRPACVLVNGPYPEIDARGEEIPYWTVCCGDNDGEPTGKIYTCWTLKVARDLGNRMAHDRRLELIDEATHA